MSESFRVRQMSWHFSAGEGENGLAGAAAGAGVGLVGQRDRVRREDHVVEPKQFVVWVDRLPLEDVEGRTRDPPLAQRFGQREPVDDRAARDVQEEGRRLQPREPAGVEEPAGLVGERAEADDEVRLLERARQQAALRFLAEQVFRTPSWLAPDDVLSRIGPPVGQTSLVDRQAAVVGAPHV